MKGLFIKGMDMPERCIDCPFLDDNDNCKLQPNEQGAYTWEALRKSCPIELLSVTPTERTGKWIPVSERLPECEQEVLICTEKKMLGKNACIDSIITPAIYEDGTMLEIESKWIWDDVVFDEWDDTEDCGIIPEGWWENRHFNPDEVYNNPVDRNVIAWMPLPEPYKEGDTE